MNGQIDNERWTDRHAERQIEFQLERIDRRMDILSNGWLDRYRDGYIQDRHNEEML